MRNYSFSREYMAASTKATQNSSRQAAENKVLTVTAEQKQKVAVAEAEATAQRARADGEAYAALKIATAQADALKVQNLALAQNKDVLSCAASSRVEARCAGRKPPTNVYGSAPMPFLSIDKK